MTTVTNTIRSLNSRCKSGAGFTLIELLTVLSIIAIITTIVSVNLSSARKQSRDVRRKTDMSAIQSAVELYANANGGKIPEFPGGLKSSDGQNWLGGTLLLSYLSTIPMDPINTDPYVYQYQSGTGTTRYSYIVDTVLESESGGNANIQNVAPVGSSPTSANFFVTGTYTDGTNVHYRVSSGGN